MIDFSESDEEAFAAAGERDGNFDSVPDGDYVVEVTNAVAQEKGGHRMLTWTLKVLTGEHAGRAIWRNNMLETKSNFEWAKRDLRMCGIVLKRLSDINTEAPRLVGLALDVTVKTTGKYTNTYLNRIHVGAAPTKESQPSGQLADDEKVPF